MSVLFAMDDFSNLSVSINRRASLVPAAVIPAPAVYTNVAAVKTLVVDGRAVDALDRACLFASTWLLRLPVLVFLVQDGCNLLWLRQLD